MPKMLDGIGILYKRESIMVMVAFILAVIGLAFSIAGLLIAIIGRKCFWKRQNYMSKINRKF